MDITGAVALVTGGTGGLGSRICHALAREGCHVVVAYHQGHDAARDLAAALASYHGRQSLALAVDLSDGAGIDELLSTIERELGGLDIVVNNAATNRWIAYPDLDALTPDVWQGMIDRNLTVPFLLSRAAAPLLRRGGRGRIINITSVAGLAPTGSSIAYAVSKAGLNHLTRCLAVALAPEILVNAVAPGLMEGTRMTEALDPAYVERSKKGAALQRATSRDDVADQVVLFCRTESITGQTIVVDAGRVFH